VCASFATMCSRVAHGRGAGNSSRIHDAAHSLPGSPAHADLERRTARRGDEEEQRHALGGVSIARTCTARMDLGYKRERGGSEDAKRTSASARTRRRERGAEQRAYTRRDIRGGIWRSLPGRHIHSFPGMSSVKTIHPREQRARGGDPLRVHPFLPLRVPLTRRECRVNEDNGKE
jgi:hypothetical protein